MLINEVQTGFLIAAIFIWRKMRAHFMNSNCDIQALDSEEGSNLCMLLVDYNSELAFWKGEKNGKYVKEKNRKEIKARGNTHL